MKPLKICLLTLSFASCLYAQDGNVLVGTISFVTSNNVYVHFDSTEEIKIGEALQLSGADCLRVTSKSSTSIVCSIINDCLIKIGDTVTYLTLEDAIDNSNEIVKEDPIPAEIIATQPGYSEKESIYSEKIRGRISLASYNTFSNFRQDRHRIRTRFSLNADHINDSKFSIETYLAYRNIIVPSESNYSGRTSIFNVYNLNVRLDATPTLSLTAGRKINPKAFSMGAIDGLQV